MTDLERELIDKIKALPGQKNSVLQKFNGLRPKVKIENYTKLKNYGEI